jgi:hypothetical protein
MDKKEKFEYVVAGIILLFGLFMLLIMRAGMLSPAMTLASIAVMVSLLIFLGLWDFGVIHVTYGIFSGVYRGVEPTSTKAKIIVAIASILYALFGFIIWVDFPPICPFS